MPDIGNPILKKALFDSPQTAQNEWFPQTGKGGWR